MKGVNKAIIVGTVTKDPETKTFANGGSITQFSVVTNETWTDKNSGEKKESAEFHRIVLNNKLGEIAQKYIHKGSKVYLEGSIKTRTWKDQNNQDRYSTEIHCINLQMLDSFGGSQNQQQQNTAPKAPQYGQRQQSYAPKPNAGGGTSDLDDLPFSYIDSRLA